MLTSRNSTSNTPEKIKLQTDLPVTSFGIVLKIPDLVSRVVIVVASSRLCVDPLCPSIPHHVPLITHLFMKKSFKTQQSGILSTQMNDAFVRTDEKSGMSEEALVNRNSSAGGFVSLTKIKMSFISSWLSSHPHCVYLVI